MAPAITWTNVDWDMQHAMGSFIIPLSDVLPKRSRYQSPKMRLKMTNLKWLPHLPGANELTRSGLRVHAACLKLIHWFACVPITLSIFTFHKQMAVYLFKISLKDSCRHAHYTPHLHSLLRGNNLHASFVRWKHFIAIWWNEWHFLIHIFWKTIFLFRLQFHC